MGKESRPWFLRLVAYLGVCLAVSLCFVTPGVKLCMRCSILCAFETFEIYAPHVMRYRIDGVCLTPIQHKEKCVEIVFQQTRRPLSETYRFSLLFVFVN